MISLKVNGRTWTVPAEPDTPLLYVLRNDLALNAAKFGCGLAQCGACTVLVNHRAVRSCSVDIRSVHGAEVVTIEGLAGDGKLHPLQEAFIAHDALQCGFCTAGMILTAYDLLLRHPDPTREEVVAGMDDNLCRCGAHVRIVDAVLEAAPAMRGAHST